MMQGQLHLAVATFGRAFQIAMARGESPTLFVGLAHAGMAEVLYEWNDLDGAMRHAKKGIELGERRQSVDVLQAGYSYIPLAQLYQARGDRKKALQLLRKAEQYAQRCKQTHVEALAAAFRARFWLAQGNLAAASRWARTIPLTTDEPEYDHEFERITLCRALLAQGKTGDALELLTLLQDAAEEMGRTGRVIEIVALQALAYQAKNDVERALSTLERSLPLAEPEGYVRTFVDQGEPMARLLRRTQTRSIAPNYVSKLLTALGETAEQPPAAAQPLIEPLSERELEVLRLIAGGLSNQEIAQELVVAVSTVKSHVNHIHGKLGVKNRTQAVARAQALGLIVTSNATQE
jgi:LuxR family maltose regulon positive regulatory protein